mgnify:CR=1 FL=1
MEKSKRVYCLYRVSTKGQVEKDDIPMQKQYCREFAESQGWTIIKEFAEKGVSGFKVAAADRDAIQEIRQDAEERKFDILLVFMFDRLGRRDDETPFVVEWFIRNGIEVWSAMEGQQKMDDHIEDHAVSDGRNDRTFHERYASGGDGRPVPTEQSRIPG